MTVMEFVDALPVLKLQGWHVENKRLRNRHLECPLVALAEMRGHKVYHSYAYARRALGLSAGDAKNIIQAADGITISESNPLRGLMKIQLQTIEHVPVLLE